MPKSLLPRNIENDSMDSDIYYATICLIDFLIHFTKRGDNDCIGIVYLKKFVKL